MIQITAYLNEPVTYIFDLLSQEIAEECKPILRSIFLNCKQLKIMHGCLGCDIPLILKEFGVHPNSVYDT